MALGDRTQQDGAALMACCRPTGVLLRVHSVIGSAECLGCVTGFLRDDDRAESGRDCEPLSLLRQGIAHGLHCRAPICSLGDYGELVAPGPVGLPIKLVGCLPERAPEALKQRVASRVAEGVVVVLEPVEVEQS